MKTFIKVPEYFILIDDDPMSNVLNYELVRRVYGQKEIRLFTDPRKALIHIEENYKSTGECRPTMMFLDLNTPTMSGWEFLKQFEQLNHNIHAQFSVFIVSSSSEQEDIEAGLANHFVSGHLLKPLNKTILGQIVPF
ncbi:MAG TPA: response regulator [Cytophagaceae bacterium]|jgi:CheY-like chemotaxis protein|nr:response regulator [Cytophagaceae bacterium]